MSGTTPPELHSLLATTDRFARERAWAAFVQKHSSILLHTARAQANGYDDTMDRYTFVLDQLRLDDFRRLRGYTCDGRTRFSTWLVVVARRLCVDMDRKRYGRHRKDGERPDGKGRSSPVDVRRDLVDLVGAQIDVADLADASTPDPETQLRRREIGEALRQSIGRLTPRERLLLRLRFDDQASVRDITDAMRFPSQFHVYRQLKAVLRRLRKSLEERGFADALP